MTGSLPTLPRVARHDMLGGVCTLRGGLHRVSGHLSSRLAQAWDRLPARHVTDPDGATACYLRLIDGGSDAAAESYTLTIEPRTITAEAPAEAGLFYAIATLRQLLIADPDRRTLPCVRIEDAPRLGWRGFMLDSARHLQPIDWIERHLDRMAALKLNRFHWHLCDDQGWRIPIPGYPALTEQAAWRGSGPARYGGFYSGEQIRHIVAYAQRRFITVIPEIEMPGHCNAALVAYPSLSCTGAPLPIGAAGLDAFTKPAGRRAFCAASEAVYTFLQRVLEEVDRLFDPPYLHIGGDETPRQCWEQCPRCTALADEMGGDLGALRLHFLGRIDAFCRRHLGKPTIAWTDGVSDRMPREQLVHAWFPGEAAAAARQGYRVINSNHEWTYLDYPARPADAPAKPGWMILLPAEKIYHFDPMPDGLEAAFADRILGSEAPLWTEHAPDEASLEQQLWPRLAAFSEALWSPRVGRCFEDFLSRHQRLGGPGGPGGPGVFHDQPAASCIT